MDNLCCGSRKGVSHPLKATNTDALNVFPLAFQDNTRTRSLARSPSTLLRAGHSPLLWIARTHRDRKRWFWLWPDSFGGKIRPPAEPLQGNADFTTNRVAAPNQLKYLKR